MKLIRANYTTLSGAFKDYSFRNNETIRDVQEIVTLYPNLFQRTLRDVFGNADEREIIFSSQIRGSVLEHMGKIQEGDIYISEGGIILKMVKGPRGVLFMIYIQKGMHLSGRVGIIELRRSKHILKQHWEFLGETHVYSLFMNWPNENPLEVK